jgi:putative selenium metabolism protein SsnA
MSRTLLVGGRVATFSEPDFYDDGAVLIGADGRIEALGPTDEVAPQDVRDAFDGEVVDLGGNLVLPGLINPHMHLYSTLARGMPLLAGDPPANFTEVLERIWWPLDRALDEESVYLSALLGLMECVRGGVTTIIDHHASEGWVAGSLDAVARAASDLGVRICTCFETTDRDGEQVSRQGFEENVRFAAATQNDPGLLGGVASRAATLGLHASLTLSADSLARAKELVGESGIPGVHVHVAEDKADPADSLAKAGVRTVERLHSAGLLGPGTIAAHCVWVDDDEVKLLAETGTKVVHNPSSNMNNAVGRTDVARLRAAGVTLAVGSDGMTGDILSQLAQAYLVRRDAAGDPRVGWDDAAAFLEGNRAVADVFFPGSGLGSLAVGGPADLAIFDYDPYTPLDGGNLLGHLLYGGLGARVRSVVCGGRFVMRDWRFPNHDLAALSERGRQQAEALWQRRSP